MPDAVPMDETRLTPSPPVTESDAAEAILACYDLSGELTRLPGEADDNFLLDTGSQRYVVKFAHLRADPAVVNLQVRVLRHIEATAPALPVPRVLAPSWTVVPGGPLRGRVVHALSYLDGRLLKTVTTDPPLRRALGGTLGESGKELSGFDERSGASEFALNHGPTLGTGGEPALSQVRTRTGVTPGTRPAT